MMTVQRIHNTFLYIFVFLFHFEYWYALGTDEYFTLTKLVGYIYFLFAALNPKRFFALKWLKPFLLPVFSFFVLLTLMSLINYSPSQKNGQFFDFQIFQCIIMFWVLCNHLSLNRQILFNSIIAFILGGIVLCVFYYLGFGSEIEEGRLKMFGDNSNSIGLRLSLSIFLLISFIIENPLHFGRLRFINIVFLLLLIPVLVSTGSRTALASLIAGLIALIVFIKTSISNKLIIITFSIFIGFYFFQFIMQNEAFALRILTTIKQGDVASRYEIWSSALEIIQDNPVFGVGITGYSSLITSKLGSFSVPHSVYIELLCYTGVVGSLFFVRFIYNTIKKGLAVYRNEDFIFPFILICMILTIFFASHGLYNKSYWFIYAIIIAFGTLSVKE